MEPACGPEAALRYSDADRSQLVGIHSESAEGNSRPCFAARPRRRWLRGGCQRCSLQRSPARAPSHRPRAIAWASSLTRSAAARTRDPHRVALRAGFRRRSIPGSALPAGCPPSGRSLPSRPRRLPKRSRRPGIESAPSQLASCRSICIGPCGCSPTQHAGGVVGAGRDARAWPAPAVPATAELPTASASRLRGDPQCADASRCRRTARVHRPGSV